MSNRGHAYKQRFKGIENFLRRVAFNLGNTPSQTEVKIISCIPIDVTDLQQKINCLEKELREVKCTAAYKASIGKYAPTAPLVQTVLGKPIPIFSESKHKVISKSSQAKANVANQACNTKFTTNMDFKRRKSNKCTASSDNFRPSSDNKELYKFTYSDSNIGEILPSTTHEKLSKISNKIVPKRLQKIMKKKPRRKTHLVYFAQAMNTPFQSHDLKNGSTKRIEVTDNNLISRSFIDDIIRKQYEQELIVDKLTDISQFSSPVCTDNNVGDKRESDVPHYFSKYENLDKFLPKKNYNFKIAFNKNLAIDPGQYSLHCQRDCNTIINNRYYNSEDYDIYPVKEKSMNRRENVQIKQIKKLNIECWPENFRAKYNINGSSLHKPDVSGEYEWNKTNNKYTNSNKVANVRRTRNRNNEGPTAELCRAKMCSVVDSNTHTKPDLIVSELQKPNKNTAKNKNAECVTVNTNNTESQTVESKAIQLNIPNDNKAELALNQIKTILQTVLAEVKTNMKSNNAVTQPKKDVIIQKNISENNINYGSTLLNSFTYNPSYNINPCVAYYPRQFPNFCYTNMPPVPLKCFQNYPFMMPTIKHQDCQCENEVSTHKVKPLIETKPAATATINMQVTQRPSQRETINLINEIYKSVALNVNYSNKNISPISFSNQKKSLHPEPKTNAQDMTIVEQQSTEEKGTQFDTPTVVLTCKTNNNNAYSCLKSTATESRSESSRTVNQSSNVESIGCDGDKACDITEQNDKETNDRNESKVEETYGSNCSDSSEDTLVANVTTEKKQKSGLFHKMLKTVKMFKRGGNRIKRLNMRNDNQSQESVTTSDSQSIYSHKTYKQVKHFTADTTVKLPSQTDGRKISEHFRKNSRKLSPYMEQEYRRYWDEKLMFHEKHSPMHSSENHLTHHSHEKSFPGWTRSPQSPMFWRGHEAKNAVLKSRPVGLKEAREPYRTKMEPVSRDKTGLKLEWHRKQKFRAPVTNHA